MFLIALKVKVAVCRQTEESQWRVVGSAASKNDFQCFVYADYNVEPCVLFFSSNSNNTPEGGKLASIPAEDVN